MKSGILFACHYLEIVCAVREDSGMDYQVKNANYERVLIVMEKYLKERYAHLCDCPRCTKDIVAIALNYLPPHYYVEEEKDKELGSPWVMVETAVTEAIDKVMENPNHSQCDRQSA